MRLRALLFRSLLVMILLILLGSSVQKLAQAAMRHYPESWARMVAAAPTLVIGSGSTVQPGASVTVPIVFQNNNNNVGSTAFAIKFNATCLTYTSTTFNSSLDSALKSADVDSSNAEQINIFVLSFTGLPATLNPLVELKFTATTDPACAPGTVIPITFSNNPSPSFGTTSGGSVAGSTTNGSVTIAELATGTPTPTATATGTVLSTSTATPTQTATPIATSTATATGPSTPTATTTATSTATDTPTITPTGTLPTATMTAMPTATATATGTATATATVTPTGTLPTATMTATSTATMTATSTATPTSTLPSETPTATATPTLEPTDSTETIVNSFVATVQGTDPAVVNLTWQTSQEVNTTSFYLYRQGGTANRAFVPLTGPFASLGTQGGTYQYTDTAVLPNTEYSYLLVERKQDDQLLEYLDRIQVVVIGTTNAPEPNQLWLPLITR